MKSKKSYKIFFIIAILFAIFVGMIFLLQPFPRGKLVVLSNYTGSVWNSLGDEAISNTSKKYGIEYINIPTNGAVENVRLLGDPTSAANVGPVFDRFLTPDQAKDIYSLGLIGLDPIWVFYKSTAKEKITTLQDIAQLRVSIGPKDSGSYYLTKKLFALNAMNIENNPHFISSPLEDAAADFLSGKTEVLIVAASYFAPVINKIFFEPDVKIFQLPNAVDYHGVEGFILVTLPAGSIDVHKTMPAEDIELIATTVSAAVKKDLQPALQLALTLALPDLVETTPYFFNTYYIHYPAPVFDAILKTSPVALKYYAKGPPFLTKYIPSWLIYFPF